MAWHKREVPETGNFISLGDGKGQVRAVGGLLVRLVPAFYQGKPKDAPDYEFINKDGDKLMLSGSVTMSKQLTASDEGKFFKAEFEGWGASTNGKFKMITVNVWEGDPDPKMTNWPHFAEYYGKKAAPAAAQKAVDESPFAEEADDLPF